VNDTREPSRTRCLEVNLKEVAKNPAKAARAIERIVYFNDQAWCMTCTKAFDATAGYAGIHHASKGNYHVTSIHCDCSGRSLSSRLGDCVDR
jgi:hypothetical protein